VSARLLDGFGARHLAVAAVFAVVYPCIGVTYKLIVGGAPHLMPVLMDSLACFVLALGAMAGVVVTDNRLGGRLGPAPRVALAALAGAVLGTLVMEATIRLALQPLGLDSEPENVLYAGEAHRVAVRFASGLTWSFMLVALYSLFQESRRAAQQLHTARVAALAAQRALLDGEVRATQARVDPDALFETLQDIDRAYAKSTTGGEEALDRLIASLRLRSA
jgi:hypothetical protein